MILLDTSGLLSLLDAGEPAHRASHEAIRDREPLVVTDLVLAETDFLILKRLGRKAEDAFLRQLLAGAFLREPVSGADLNRAHEILRKFADQDIGLCDAVTLALAERLSVSEVLTLDRRHFAPFRTKKGHAFTLLP